MLIVLRWTGLFPFRQSIIIFPRHIDCTDPILTLFIRGHNAGRCVMQRLSTCSICSVFERLQLPWLGYLSLIIGGLAAVFSMVAWPLMFIWPVLFLIGFGLAAGHGACTECRLS